MSHPWSLSGHAPQEALKSQGFALLEPGQLEALTGVGASALADWRAQWNRLPADAYLRDGGRYRSRRHGCFIQSLARDDLGTADPTTGERATRKPPTGDELTLAPRRPHWQSTDYNALHGGIDRWFEPLEEALTSDGRWRQLLCSLGRLFAGGHGTERWYIEAHQFRIDASDGVGRPTPEGAHRDGVDFVAVILVNRQAVKGGETRVFQAEGPLGMRFVIAQPWSALLLDDARVIHETTPIQPTGQGAVRDTLVLTYRRRGFQSTDAAEAGAGDAAAGAEPGRDQAGTRPELGRN